MRQFVSSGVSLDNLRFQLPIGSNRVDYNAFTDVTHKRDSGVTIYKAYPKKHQGKHGVNLIEAIPEADKLTVDTNAKALGIDYRQGINPNTFGQLIDSINGTGLIHVEADDVYHNATVRRADPVQTLELSELPEKVVQALKLLNGNRKYGFKHHPKGTTIERKAKHGKDRGNFYGKYDELLMAKNRDFVEATPGIISTFTPNSFRAEHQLTTFDDIRTGFGIDDKQPRIVSIFNSRKNPVHAFYRALCRDIDNQIEQTMQIAEQAQNRKDFYERLLLAHVGYDAERAIEALSLATNSRLNSRDRKNLKQLAMKLSTTEADLLSYRAIINELDKKLLEAV